MSSIFLVVDCRSPWRPDSFSSTETLPPIKLLVPLANVVAATRDMVNMVVTRAMLCEM